MKVTPKRPRTRASVSAFTLIELLVVISIIAIIAAILFPVFAQVREKARETTCISNLRQVGIAVRQYVSDYDETFPIFQAYNVKADYVDSTLSAPPWTQNHLGVEMEVNPYIASHDIFRCPDDAGDPQNTANYAVAFGSSYRFDRGGFTTIAGALGSFSNDQKAQDPNFNTITANTIVTDSSYQNEANTRIMRDEEFPWFSPTADPGGAKYGYAGTGASDYYKPWHPRGGGIVFADGHAKFVVSECTTG